MKKILLVLVFLFLTALSFSYSPKDDFYSRTGEWDMVRLPLIYPYEATNLFNSMKWKVVDKSSFVIVGNVKSLHVDKERGIIIGFADKYTYVGDSYDAEYFIITVLKEEHEIFKSKDEFEARLKELGIEDCHFETVSTYMAEFLDRGRCDWFPENYYRRYYLRYFDPEWRKKQRENRRRRWRLKRELFLWRRGD